jgi:hypothetical protein
MNSEEQNQANVVPQIDRQYEDYKATIVAFEKDKENKAAEFTREIRKRDLTIEQLKKDVAERDRKVLAVENEKEIERKSRVDAQNTLMATQYYKEQQAEKQVMIQRAAENKAVVDIFQQKFQEKLQRINR